MTDRHNQYDAIKELFPVVESDVFKGHKEARYWMGKVAIPGLDPIMPDEFLAQRRLRANIYINERHFLPEDARDTDGGESDKSDPHATQYVVLENCQNAPRAIGALRMIQKGKSSLPAEEIFSEELAAELPGNSLEASRFIARHKERTAQTMISIGLVRAAILQALSQESNIYAVVEEPLAQRFNQLGLEYDVLCKSKILPEYNNTDNMLLRFQPDRIMEIVKKDLRFERPITVYFDVKLQNLGLGHFDKLLRQTNK